MLTNAYKNHNKEKIEMEGIESCDRRGNEGDEMVGRKDRGFRNDGHLYGH